MPAPVKIVGGQKGQVPGVEIGSDQFWGAVYAAIKPLDYTGPGGLNILGHYRVAKNFANTAAQTGPLFTWRWGIAATVGYMVPTRISCSGVITTAFTTAQVTDVMATRATAYSVSATAGTAFTPFGNSNKMRANMANSQVTDMRYGAVTAGTRTLDAAPFAAGVLSSGNTALAGVLPQIDLYNAAAYAGAHPLVHTLNEGVEISAATALGAAGVLTYYITVEWAEVVAF